MTVAELIFRLQKYSPETKVISFHEDLRTITHQMQDVHDVNYVNVAGHRWVVLQAKGITYENMKPDAAQ